MLGNILVPLDGSPLADRILPHVAALARPDGPSITLLRVLEVGDVEAQAVDPLAWHFARAEAQAHLEEAAAQLAGWGLACTTALLEGAAAQSIVEYSQRHGAGLLALSSHGQGGQSGWNISGIAQKVIHRAGASILLVRTGASQPEADPEAHPARYRSILAPLDGSLRAESALPVAAALAERHEAALLLAHVVRRPEMIQRVPLSVRDAALAERVIARNRQEADRYMAQLRARTPARAQARVLVDDSVTWALHHLVDDEQVDLVVLSAHGQGCRTEWPYSALVNNFIIYGSTTLLIVQDLPYSEVKLWAAEPPAQQPILPVRRAAEDEEQASHGSLAA